MKKGTKFLSLGMALIMVLSMIPFSLPASAEVGNQDVKKSSRSYEPWKHGYRFVDVLNWAPTTDSYADEMRASVPLQNRNEAFAATQANPNLKSDAKLYNVSGGNYRSTDVSEAPWNGGMAYDAFSYQLYKFWQYTDIIGAGGRPTSGIDVGESQKEYGIIALPIPAYVNAAHKNGAIAIGEWFLPREPQYTEEVLYKDKDGNFPYAKKLVEMMKYYGFDGYFINQEVSFDSSKVPIFKELLAWMVSQGCYIQWYDAITASGYVNYTNEFDAKNAAWVKDSTYGKVSDSVFLNYWWTSETINNSVNLAKKMSLNPFDVSYLGIEAGFENGSVGFHGTSYGSGHTTKDLPWALDKTGNPVMSFAIWGGDFTHEQFNKPDGRYQVDYQWEAEERERMWFTNVYENLATPGTFSSSYVLQDSNFNRKDVGVGPNPTWQGISKYIAERSVIHGTVFSTDFNTGHGMQYFKNGAVSRNMEWTNVNLQDILPTWQWWVDTASNNNALSLDWDYGTQYTRKQGAFPYQQIGAYNGGSSLVVYGNLKETNYINLYKTDLTTKANSSVSFTYNKPSATDSSALKLGVIFKKGENSTEKVLLPIPNSGGKTDGWRTVSLPLGNYAGREIASIGLEVSAADRVDGYQVNLGQLKILDGTSYTPAAPTGFAVDYAFDSTGEIKVSWNLDDYKKVQQYHIYAAYKDGSERFVGGAYADNYYIQTLENPENVVSLKLKAVGVDGIESAPAVVRFNRSRTVSNIQTQSRENKLAVTWDEPQTDFDSVKVTLDYWYSNKTGKLSTTVAKGVGAAVLDIPLEDGSQYVLHVTTCNKDGTENAPVDYFGKLADKYSEKFSGDIRVDASGKQINVSTPLASDWNTLYLTVDGTTRIYARYGSARLKNVPVTANFKNVSVVIEDKYGNRSEPANFIFVNGKPIDTDILIDETYIPDGVLRQAVIAQVGPTIGDMLQYSGKLDVAGLAVKDLTGISYIGGIYALDISGTQVEDLTPVSKLAAIKTLTASDTQIAAFDLAKMPATLKTIDLSDSTKLESLHLENLAGDVSFNANGCAGLQKIYLTGTKKTTFDISDFPNLTHFYANNSSLETLTYSNPSDYTKILYFDISGSKFDLSTATPEQKIVDALKNGDYAQPNELKFNNQNPSVIYGKLPEDITLTKDSTARMMDYFEKNYKEASTVRGTPIANLEGADWLVGGYHAAELSTAPSKVYVEIYNSNNMLVNPPDENNMVLTVNDEEDVARNATVLGRSGEFVGETAAMMFDNKLNSKWCIVNNTGWAVFQIPEAVAVGQWVTQHAGAGGESASYNTNSFELQVLNTKASGLTEDAFIASGPSFASMANEANWTAIASVNGNTADVTNINMEDAPKAKLYRLKINKATNSASNVAIRIYGMELYAMEAVARDTEGRFTPDTVGTYTVQYKRGKSLLGSMKVNVEEKGAAALAAAKESAAKELKTYAENQVKQAINQLVNLSPEEKQSFSEKVDNAVPAENANIAKADTLEAVQAALAAAKANLGKVGAQAIEKDNAAKAAKAAEAALAAAKENAAKELKTYAENTVKQAINQMANLSPEEKQSFSEKVDNAVPAENANIAKADTLEAVQAALTAAKANLDKVGAQATEKDNAAKAAKAAEATLAAAKENAAKELKTYAENTVKQAINQLANLKAEEKAAWAAKAEEAVKQGLAAIAQATDATAVADAQNDAITKLNAISADAAKADAAKKPETPQETGKPEEPKNNGGSGTDEPKEEPKAEAEHHDAYIKGYPDGTVKPNQDLTRAEAAQMIYNLLGKGATDTKNYSVSFKDVRPGSWYAKAVGYLESTNLLKGYPDGTFKPNAKITRAEMATIVARMQNLPQASAGVKMFPDVSAKSWAYAYIAGCYQAGFIQGYPDGSFGPEKNITRAEAVTILNRVTNRNTTKEELVKFTTSFKDLQPTQWSYRYIMEAANAHDFTRNADGTEAWKK